MGRSIGIRILISLVTAVAVTVVIYLSDQTQRVQRQVEDSLYWARQFSAQVQSLMFMGMEREEKNPLAWAARRLNQGVEPRMVKIFSAHVSIPVDPTTQEVYDLDFQRGELDYLKLISPETSTGVRIQVRIPYLGFLGATSRFQSDLRVLGLFLILFFSFFSVHLSWRRIKEVRSWINGRHSPSSESDLPEDLRVMVQDWVLRCKKTFSTLGSELRSILKAVVALIQSNQRQKTYLQKSRGSIRRAEKVIDLLLLKVKDLEQNLELFQAENLVEKSQEIQRNLVLLREDVKKGCINVDQAMNEIDALFKSQSQIHSHLKATHVAMADQVEMISELKEKSS